jgi:hypothetical protein
MRTAPYPRTGSIRLFIRSIRSIRISKVVIALHCSPFDPVRQLPLGLARTNREIRIKNGSDGLNGESRNPEA